MKKIQWIFACLVVAALIAALVDGQGIKLSDRAIENSHAAVSAYSSYFESLAGKWSTIYQNNQKSQENIK